MSKRLLTKYVTKDEFLAYSGINLDMRLKDDDNPSDKANSFLYRIERRMDTFLNANFYRNIDLEYPQFTDYQKEHYKQALMEQAIYILRNGDISTDSGYDPEGGFVAGADRLKHATIAPNAKEELMLCGLWCRKIRTRRGVYEWLG